MRVAMLLTPVLLFVNTAALMAQSPDVGYDPGTGFSPATLGRKSVPPQAPPVRAEFDSLKNDVESLKRRLDRLENRPVESVPGGSSCPGGCGAGATCGAGGCPAVAVAAPPVAAAPVAVARPATMAVGGTHYTLTTDGTYWRTADLTQPAVVQTVPVYRQPVLSARRTVTLVQPAATGYGSSGGCYQTQSGAWVCPGR